jgi:hypothetical protein
MFCGRSRRHTEVTKSRAIVKMYFDYFLNIFKIHYFTMFFWRILLDLNTKKHLKIDGIGEVLNGAVLHGGYSTLRALRVPHTAPKSFGGLEVHGIA